ncbi:chromosome partitioning protein ParB [Paenibacillus sp. LC231]|uniref:ParB/RepB/Spo0J family partition protein n=1 Tax=Paenibacillus sp. LC231 TaxID=1120679 RepID=UPI0008DD3BDC|nr:ParB/RepB/Spo0J family partition protein [Paenibacillus sp. LC231]OIA99368.1 chromosome partitioning protein ParB [Paenibacillus sp. LC231]
MAAKEDRRASIKLTTVDDLFTTEETRNATQKEQIKEIPLADISDFLDHPFKVKADDAMLEMAESVKQYGVLVPVLVRPKTDGGFEMVAGHRRKKASEMAGMVTIPCIVRELDDDQATIIMVDSNLQREHVSPSEKAFAYRMKLNAMKRQAGRPSKENAAQVGQDINGKYSVEILAEQVGESRNQIKRYIRLTELISPILEMVDNKDIAFSPAVEISYLAEKEQQALLETMQAEDCTPSLAQAQRMKKLSQDGKLNGDVIFGILTEEKPNQKEKLTIRKERLSRFFPQDYTVQQMEEVIVQLVENWYRRKQREREHER